MPSHGEDLIRRYETLVERRRLWEPDWEDLATYILPRKTGIVYVPQSGERKTTKLFDSTAIKSNEDLAAAMQGTLTSRAIRWFSLRMRQAELNDLPGVSAWLEENARRMYAAFQQSNFASEVHEVYLDLGAFGTGSVSVEGRGGDLAFSGLMFRSYPIGRYVVAENPNGFVDTVFLEFKLTVRAAASKFGIERLSESTQKKHGAGKLDEDIVFLQAIFPRAGGREGDDVKATELPVASVFLEKQQKHVVRESGFHEMPLLVPRWTKTSGEEYGRGPGHVALPDVKTLNKATDLKLRAWAKAIDPPLMAMDRGVVGAVKLTPAAINIIRDKDAIRPLESAARFDVTAIQEEQLRQAIRRAFFNEQLQFPPMQGTPASATEIQIRFELMQRILGPTLGRLETEFLTPLIDRVFALMFRAKALPPVPPELAEAISAGEGEIDIEYQGPLARTQRSADLAAVERTYAVLGGIAQVAPEVLDVLKHQEVGAFVAEVTGLPGDLVNSEAERAEIREARTAAKEQAAKMDQVMAVAEAAGKVAPMVKAAQTPPQTPQAAPAPRR